MASFGLFVHRKWPTRILEKSVFDPFLTHFWSPNCPLSKHYGILHGPQHIRTGWKRAKSTSLCPHIKWTERVYDMVEAVGTLAIAGEHHLKAPPREVPSKLKEGKKSV